MRHDPQAVDVWRDEKTGLWCAIVAGPLGCLNGYVAVSADHPWFEKDYGECLNPESCDSDWHYECTPEGCIDVHGGITFSATGSCLGLEWPWCFGFDTAHAGDFVPQLADLGLDINNDFSSVQWTVEMVREEVERMARQIAEVSG